MNTTYFTTLHDLAWGFLRAMDLFDPQLHRHHEKVMYIAYRLAEGLGFDQPEKQLTVLGALLYDSVDYFSEDQPGSDPRSGSSDLSQTNRILWQMMGQSPGHASAFEQDSLSFQKMIEALEEQTHILETIGQIVQLGDIVSRSLSEDKAVLNQVDDVRQRVQQAGGALPSKITGAFERLCPNEGFWFDLLYQPRIMLKDIRNRYLSLDDTLLLTELMARITDFRSTFTVMHSAGVAETAVELAGRAGMSESECKMMRIAGNLHDIGKIKTPIDILEKPGKLTEAEFNVMKEHVYYTHILLKDISGFEPIATWAAFHHEKLDGSGYPFHMNDGEILLGSRIMTVADIFSAIAEDRPYRKGMDRESAIRVLRENADRGQISSQIVESLIRDYDEIDEKRARASAAVSSRYQTILEVVSC